MTVLLFLEGEKNFMKRNEYPYYAQAIDFFLIT